ncbi:MAG TPA: flagellar hook capping FlgD N-terminal domain-containing protein [Bacillota bacterium]|jgi:flagellar basal-body rod modification protein FlgD|nr:flagellar hook capping FlgD N-terminal domain-containing protein [Bacillota bacterium]
MAIDGISSYQQTTGITEAKSKAGNGLSMDDFFKLLVAQISNQDMFNTVDDTQFIAQMAQFSMVQALSELSQASATAYSVSLIGKEATVASIGADGNMQTCTGIVDSVTLYNGSPKITIDGQQYELNSVMEVKEPNIIVPQNNLGQDEKNGNEAVLPDGGEVDSDG